MNIIFKTLDFQDFTPQQLYAYMQLRSEVFVVEQNCVYQDLDGIDQLSKHVLVYQEEQLIACARIVPANVLYAGNPATFKKSLVEAWYNS